MYEDKNFLLNTHLDNLNGLLNGTDSNSWPEKAPPEPSDWFAFYPNCFTEEGFDPELEEGSELVVFNGPTLGVLNPDYQSYRVEQQDFRAEDHPDYQGNQIVLENEIKISDPEHLSVHKHDARSFALLQMVVDTFVSIQFAKTYDEMPLIDWELTRAVCEYLASEMTIHKTCRLDCDLKALADRVFTEFRDLTLPAELQFRARNWSDGIYCPQCTEPEFLRSIVKPPASLFDLNISEFPLLPEFEKGEPVRYCLECGWQE
jgi:hypothetical protein